MPFIHFLTPCSRWLIADLPCLFTAPPLSPVTGTVLSEHATAVFYAQFWILQSPSEGRPFLVYGLPESAPKKGDGRLPHYGRFFGHSSYGHVDFHHAPRLISATFLFKFFLTQVSAFRFVPPIRLQSAPFFPPHAGASTSFFVLLRLNSVSYDTRCMLFLGLPIRFGGPLFCPLHTPEDFPISGVVELESPPGFFSFLPSPCACRTWCPLRFPSLRNFLKVRAPAGLPHLLALSEIEII